MGKPPQENGIPALAQKKAVPAVPMFQTKKPVVVVEKPVEISKPVATKPLSATKKYSKPAPSLDDLFGDLEMAANGAGLEGMEVDDRGRAFSNFGEFDDAEVDFFGEDSIGGVTRDADLKRGVRLILEYPASRRPRTR